MNNRQCTRSTMLSVNRNFINPEQQWSMYTEMSSHKANDDRCIKKSSIKNNNWVHRNFIDQEHLGLMRRENL